MGKLTHNVLLVQHGSSKQAVLLRTCKISLQVQTNKTINHQYYCWVVLAVSSSTDKLK